MGRLIQAVHEAEEKLAGLARALQTAWEEELAEAVGAQAAARSSCEKAAALADAAQALGRPELSGRFEEVMSLLRNAETLALKRIEELQATGLVFQSRLESAERRRSLTPAPTAPPPAPQAGEERAEGQAALTPSPSEPLPVVPTPEPETEQAPEAPVEEPPALEEEAPPPPPSAEEPGLEPAPEPLSGPETQESTEPPAPAAPAPRKPGPGLAERVDELSKVARRLPVTVLVPALEELVAVSRLQATGPGEARAAQGRAQLERLRALCARLERRSIFGLSSDEFADWSATAQEARARRLEAIKAEKTKRRG